MAIPTSLAFPAAQFTQVGALNRDFAPLADLKNWLRISYDDDDALLETLLTSAVAQAERATNLHICGNFISAQYKCPGTAALVLTETPIGVGAITPTDDTGRILAADITQRVHFNNTIILPTGLPAESWSGDVSLLYNAGMTATTSQTPLMRNLVWLLVAGAYEHRGSETDRPAMPNPAADRIIKLLRKPKTWHNVP